ncbi:MAG TPA: 50S ribosomal protein L10 [Bryobacteraceae bacterium]|nr:50S ribosomal protein L10 [Bryobacteraceae bacterium]HOQ47432.1 50S ribosomal protein L10 [Bryobacteraceae bacterium]HPQ15736.1 50S ribosomal protein L10 [Bryobacteraceae bacterium]HPU74059.1 50S ribosomal protein L10 [Bryobacteraceae bacterium]
MKKRSDKQKEVQALRQELEQARHLFVTGFEKLTVAQDFELRKAIRAAGGRYRVVKNNLAEKAAEGTSAESMLKGITGMTSLAYTDSDPVALAKALTTYAKANPTLVFKAGMVEGRVIDIRTIQDLANLPSKEQLIGMLMFLVNSPAQRLAVALNGVARNLAVVLNEAVKEKKFKEQ